MTAPPVTAGGWTVGTRRVEALAKCEPPGFAYQVVADGEHGQWPVGLFVMPTDAALDALAPELAAALQDARARLAGFIGVDCECDNTHAANGTVCCLCEYAGLLARLTPEGTP